jgi:hypothetical protein
MINTVSHYNATKIAFFITIPITGNEESTTEEKTKKCKNCKVVNYHYLDKFCSRCGGEFVFESKERPVVIPTPNLSLEEIDINYVPLLDEEEYWEEWVFIIKEISDCTYAALRGSVDSSQVYDLESLTNKFESYKNKYADFVSKYNGKVCFGMISTYEEY